MSSPKAALVKPARRAKPAARPSARPAKPTRSAKPAAEPPQDNAADAALSAQASRLAAELERGLSAGRTLSSDALQALMAALCRSYSVQVEAGSKALPLQERGGATGTDVMVMASGLLRSANLAVFELGMWQSWTGR